MTELRKEAEHVLELLTSPLKLHRYGYARTYADAVVLIKKLLDRCEAERDAE